MSIVLVTGARGFIGRHLSRVLAREGKVVVGVGHGVWPSSDSEQSGLADCLEGDIDARNLGRVFDRHGTPEQVFHLAGGSSVGASLNDPRSDFFRSVGSTLELLEWLRQNAPNARVVAASSAAVYGAGHSGPIKEDAPLRPHSPYGHHKLMMETLLRSYGVAYGTRSVIVRLFSVYGDGLRKQLLFDLCSRLAAGQRRIELHGNGDELRDWTEVSDTVRAVVETSQLADRGAPVINVGSGVATSVRDIAGLVVSAWSCRTEVTFNGRLREGDPASLLADASRLHALGFTWRTPVSTGIADYVSWFRSLKPG